MLDEYSDPKEAQLKAFKYLGISAILYKATHKNKKYCIYDPNKKKFINFGQIGYQDFTIHHDNNRRLNYLKRSSSIKGDWRDNLYSSNNLSRNILW